MFTLFALELLKRFLHQIGSILKSCSDLIGLDRCCCGWHILSACLFIGTVWFVYRMDPYWTRSLLLWRHQVFMNDINRGVQSKHNTQPREQSTCCCCIFGFFDSWNSKPFDSFREEGIKKKKENEKNNQVKESWYFSVCFNDSLINLIILLNLCLNIAYINIFISVQKKRFEYNLKMIEYTIDRVSFKVNIQMFYACNLSVQLQISWNMN